MKIKHPETKKIVSGCFVFYLIPEEWTVDIEIEQLFYFNAYHYRKMVGGESSFYFVPILLACYLVCIV